MGVLDGGKGLGGRYDTRKYWGERYVGLGVRLYLCVC